MKDKKLELPVVDDTRIWDAWLALYDAPAISVALELEVFESLTEPASAEVLAKRLGFSIRGLAALLSMLNILELLDKRDDEYQLTTLSRHYMLKDSPYFWGGLFSRVASTLPMHQMLLDNVRDDSTEIARAADGWESGHLSAEEARTVTDFMHSHSVASAVGLAHTCDFSKNRKILDVGGGSGCFSIALAQHYEQLNCTVMDLPTICTVAEEYIARAGVSDRVNATSVDMFRENWPKGYDGHFFSNIFHDWSLETCADLAKSSFDALESGGSIYLQEMLLNDDGDGPKTAVAFSILMCLGTKGQQFTFAQLEDILSKAGFKEIKAQPSYGYYSLVSGKKL